VFIVRPISASRHGRTSPIAEQRDETGDIDGIPVLGDPGVPRRSRALA
jgi:hypothetical protein